MPIVFVLVILLLSLTTCSPGCSSGNGKKVGQIVKIAQHGMVCPTYEAELIRGGFNGGSGINGAAFDFTIPDEDLYRKLTEVMESGQEIELKYTRVTGSGWCVSETSYMATGFVPMHRSNDVEAKKQELLKQLQELEKSKK